MGHRKDKKKKFSKQKNKKSPKVMTFPFPFLEHDATIDSIKKQFKVMFIMRGLPGSGKSTLVKEIITIYPNAVICSADHYFTEDGQYVWSPERRHYAHQYSMRLAAKSCEVNCPLVVIDNTNITENEAKAYFEIALKYSYVIVLVCPQTSWRFDPTELEKRGIHNVSQKALQIKVKRFQDVLPEFYAWFVGQQDAAMLKTLAVHHFQECLKNVPQFRAEISKIQPEEQSPDDKQKDSELENHFSNILKDSLFCIAKNCLKGKVPGSLDFHAKDIVQKSCGKVFVLQVSKILVTPDFLLACVELTSLQKTLYGHSTSENLKKTHKEDLYKVVGKSKQEEKEKEKDDSVYGSVGYTDDEELHRSCLEKVESRLSLMLSYIKPGVGIEAVEENPMTESQPVESLPENISPTKEEETTEKTSIENFTEAAAMAGGGGGESSHSAVKVENEEEKEEEEVQPKDETSNSLSKEEEEEEEEGELATILLAHHSNVDPENCSAELKKVIEMENAKDGRSFERISTDDSDIVHFNDGICIVHLKEKLQIDAIFSGLY